MAHCDTDGQNKGGGSGDDGNGDEEVPGGDLKDGENEEDRMNDDGDGDDDDDGNGDDSDDTWLGRCVLL